MKITTDLLMITPDIAMEMLSSNTGNRKLNPKHVNFLVGCMTRGEWEYNGDDIKFDAHGKLIDGQHRLEAIAKSGIPQLCGVKRGLPVGSFMTLDTNELPRSTAQVLQLSGEKDATALAAAVNLIHDITSGHSVMGSVERRSPAYLKSFIEKHPGIRDSVTFTGRLTTVSSMLGRGKPAGLHYLFSLVDEAEANAYFSDLESGIFRSTTDPVYLLRQKLIQNMSMRDKMSRTTIIAMAIKCWNFRIQGKHLTRLQYSSIEGFPVIEGKPKRAYA